MMPQEWVEKALTSMRNRREYQAGVAFGVPDDARDQHDEALVLAVLAAVAPEVVARVLHVQDGFEPEFWNDEETERDLYDERARTVLRRITRQEGELRGQRR